MPLLRHFLFFIGWNKNLVTQQSSIVYKHAILYLTVTT